MEMNDKLPDDLVWLDGHLTDVALSALADGEEAILPEQAAAHAAGCAACGGALGHAALLSLRVGEALREAQPAPVAEALPAEAAGAAGAAGVTNALARPAAEVAAQASPGLIPEAARPLPVTAVVAALVIAALASAPQLAAARVQLPEMVQALWVGLAVTARAARTVMEGGGPEAPGWFAALPWVSAALLVMVGLAVARAAGRKLPLEGETR